jgi:hypothetical protein
MPELKKPDEKTDYGVDPNILNNTQYILKDLIQGDNSALKEIEGLDMNTIKKALDFLTNNDSLDEKQKIGLLQDSWKINYRAKPPTPEEFLTAKYLGPTADTLYPWVKQTFIDFMNPTAEYRNLILYPHIGWGKSFLSTLITLYLDICVSLMHDPNKYFGLSKATSFSSMLISYSIKKSYEVLVSPFMNIMESSPFFERVTRRDSMQELVNEFKQGKPVTKLYYTSAAKDKSSIFEFDSGLSIKAASSPQALLGLTLVSITYSELAFFTDAGKSSDYILRIYNDGKARVRSRLETNQVDYKTGNKIVDYYGRSILDSSPNDLNNAIDDYIVNKASEDPTNYIVKGSRWEWRPDDYKNDFETGNTFQVYLGGRGNPPKILEKNDPILESDTADKNKIITVPGSLKQVFKDDLKKALKDWAGIPTGTAGSLVYDYIPLERMFNNNLKNIYLNIEAPADASPRDLIWNQICPMFFKNRNGQYEFYYKPRIPRCLSVDQSYATDVTSISMSHVERLGDTGELIYVVDFCIPILPTKKSNINLEAIRIFIEDLKKKGHINLAHISFDQFQSETTIQNLQREKFEVEKLSVDKTMDPYLNMISLMNTGRIACGRNIFLKNNIKSLNVVRPKTEKGKSKIDHDNSREQVLTGDDRWDTSKIGWFGKDVSDSVCASIELCRLYFPLSEETWTGGPKKEDLTPLGEQKNAEDQTNKLLESLGLSL